MALPHDVQGALCHRRCCINGRLSHDVQGALCQPLLYQRMVGHDVQGTLGQPLPQLMAAVRRLAAAVQGTLGLPLPLPKLVAQPQPQVYSTQRLRTGIDPLPVAIAQAGRQRQLSAEEVVVA